MLEVIPDLGEISSHELMFIRKMFYFRHLNCNGANQAMMMQAAKIRPNSPGYLEAAILARDFQTTDPRDKIFALWNLARDKKGLEFEMSYTRSTQEIYQDFAVAWAEQHGCLDIIGTAENSNDLESFNLPSWCPDWSTPSKVSCLVRREQLPTRFMAVIDDIDGVLYSADGGMQQQTPNQYFTIEGNTLFCTAIILDQITTVFDEPPEPPRGMRFHGSDPFIQWKVKHYLQKIQTHYFFTSTASPYPLPSQSATAMFHGDTVSAWPHRSDTPENISESEPNEEYVCLPSASRHVLSYADSYCRIELLNILRSTLFGRVLFVSEGGYMGLAPYYVSDVKSLKQPDSPDAGDPDTNAEPPKPYLVAIIATCSVPILLQENSDGSYRFCGTCFVQGWMEGEMLTEYMGFGKPKEFWEAFQGSDRIRIK